ncbi:MAG TPA: type II toxin-antitoxin system VapC family toxin [Candidatus Bathyarchaeia archaeon]|nr:type II toxin-antitoxin system VapC family toxin [Candidatus Bathyarchaeia archaeon]
MRLLLDTHVLLWWLSDDRKLAKNARDIIANSNNDVLVSSASVWEVAIKAALGRLEVELDDLEDAIVRNGFRPLPIGFRHAVTVGRLPAVHRDPFDRMLVAQASVEELRLVSHDRVFERYGLRGEGLPPIII